MEQLCDVRALSGCTGFVALLLDREWRRVRAVEEEMKIRAKYKPLSAIPPLCCDAAVSEHLNLMQEEFVVDTAHVRSASAGMCLACGHHTAAVKLIRCTDGDWVELDEIDLDEAEAA